MDKKLWIIGCGDIGQRVAKCYFQNKKPKTSICINAVVRTELSKNLCEKQGIKTFLLDLDHLGNKAINFGKQIKDNHLFYFVPPPNTGRTDTRLQQFLASLSEQPKRIILISTTGVYGDSKGKWINEKAAIKPQAERAYRRLSAEHLLQQWAQTHKKEYIILRVAGIYAKDRLPLARLKKGLPVVNQAEAGWTNRIHADDLAMICQLAMESDITNEIYNVTDGHPSTMTDYFNQVADYAGLERPPQISLQQAEEVLSEGMLSYLRESRRISNQKILDQLGVKLQYPNLQQGLKNKTSKK